MICPICGEEIFSFAKHLKVSETCRVVLNDSLSSRSGESYEPSSNGDPDMEVTKR